MRIDFVRYLNAVTRRVEDATRENRPVKVAVMSCIYDTDVEDLWEAVTNPERIARSFLPISGRLEVGGRFQLEGNAGGEILRCEPPRVLEVTWCFGDDSSWVNLRLAEESPGKTRFELRHAAYLDERWSQFGPGAVGVGWDGALLGLGLHVSGTEYKKEQIAAWSASEEGKEFMSRSSRSWRDASIRAGEAAEAAEAAEKRTTAFYTGIFEER